MGKTDRNPIVGKVELLGLPGSGKSHLLKQMAASGEGLLPHNIPYGFGAGKLLNLLLGFITVGPVTLLMLLRMARGQRLIGQIKLLLVLCERAGRLSRGPDSIVIDEGILQALWGFLWRTGVVDGQPGDTRVCEVTARLVSILPQVYYLRTRRDLHRQRIVIGAGGSDNPGLFRFTEDYDYLQARKTMALLLRALRTCGVAVILKSNVDDGASSRQ